MGLLRAGPATRLAVTVAVASALLLTSCSSSNGSAGTTSTSFAARADNDLVDEGTPVRGGNLAFGVRSETDGWNPATNQWAQEGHIIGSTMFETLFVNNAEGEPVPWLAESATPNEDYTVWSITLRQGVKFHDGTEMDAEGVVKDLIFANTPPSLAAFAYPGVFGTPVATGKYTLDIPLNVSWGVMPVMLTSATGYVMAPSMLDKPNAGTQDPVGTGAYRWVKGESGRFVQVGAFDDYWGGACTIDDPPESVVGLCADMGVPLGQPNGPFLDSIEFRPIVDSIQRAQALESGDIQIMMTSTPADTARLRGDFQVVTDYTTEKSLVMLSTTRPPFDNIHARKALAYATDRQAIKDLVSAGEDIAMDTSPFAEDSRWGGLAPDKTGYPAFDQAKAREEIEAYKADMVAAGTPVEALKLNLLSIAAPEEVLLEQLLAEQWAEVGIVTDLDTRTQNELINEVVGSDWQAMMFRNYAYSDPDFEYVFWSEENASGLIRINFTGFWNEVTQDAITRGRASADVETRRKAYADFAVERNANVPELWLYSTPWALVAEPNVMGLNAFRTMGMASFASKPYISGLWIDPEA